ncbi:MAG: multiheme c-type cytochrome [Sandaracinaceae bacterium]
MSEARRPDARLVVLTDLDGMLEPCGCTSRPLGGIDRLAAKLEELRAERIPFATVLAGNVFFHGAPHGGDAERARSQEELRADALVEILGGLDVAAATPGSEDLGFGAATFDGLAERLSAPILAAGVTVGERAFASSRTVTLGDLRVGILGLTDLNRPDGTLPDGVSVADDELRVLGAQAARELREAGADVVVALVNAERRTTRRVATGIEGVDFVIQGGLDQADVNPPADTEGATILHAGRQGQGFVVLDLYRGAGELRDVSAWTVEAQRTHLDEGIESLEGRIASWEAEGRPDAELAAQRERLSRMRRERDALSVPAVGAGKAFSARYIELPPEAERSPTVRARMVALDRRINDVNREAFADWAPEPAPEGAAHYVGSNACGSCHSEAMRWWRGHPHGHAYATLADQHKNFNLSCVGCHVTGYLEPGGSTVTHTGPLENVGCESCHGPGSIHVGDPAGDAGRMIRDPEEARCARCHTPDHSDRFDYTAYRATLLVPGHGRPSEAASNGSARPARGD